MLLSVLLNNVCHLLRSSAELFVGHGRVNTNERIASASFLPDHNGDANILSGPTGQVGSRAESRANKVLDGLVLRRGQYDAEAEFVLNILPLAVERGKAIGFDGTSAIREGVLQDELTDIAAILSVAAFLSRAFGGAPATKREHASKYKCENAHTVQDNLRLVCVDSGARDIHGRYLENV